MKKKLLAAALSTALGAGVGLQSASADTVFGPFFDTSPGVFTFVSIVTKADRPISPYADPKSTADIDTEWVYLYKNLSELEDACVHSDGNGEQTANDLGTFDLVGQSTLFNDTTSTGDFISPGFTGMFAVESLYATLPVSGTSTSESTISGEVIIADINTGNVLSYRMMNHPYQQSRQFFDELASKNPLGPQGSTQFSRTGEPDTPTVIWHPATALNTSWFVMAPQNDMFRSGSVPDLSLTIQFSDSSYNAGFYYDRNENRNSTSQKVTFNCIAQITLADLVDAGKLQEASDNGGWAHLQVTEFHPLEDGNSKSDIGVLIYKLESAGNQSIWTSENRVDL